MATAANVTVSFDGPGSLGLALIEDAGGRVLIETVRPDTLASCRRCMWRRQAGGGEHIRMAQSDFDK